jgi:hypothetical protein
MGQLETGLPRTDFSNVALLFPQASVRDSALSALRDGAAGLIPGRATSSCRNHLMLLAVLHFV